MAASVVCGKIKAFTQDMNLMKFEWSGRVDLKPAERGFAAPLAKLLFGTLPLRGFAEKFGVLRGSAE
jgi:hypothetical protein